MKLLPFLLVLLVMTSGVIFAQHVELGIFANYDRQSIQNAPQNLFGVGGRANFNLTSILQLELESAYDFKYPHFEVTEQGSTVIINTSKLGLFHANAGFKVQTPDGSFFLFLKGGVNQYQFSSNIQNVSGVPPTVDTIVQPDNSYAKGVLYPGGGIGFHAGPLGIRLDVGDEIHWVNGDTKHSVRVTFGPTFRF
jgi:hypothetical protein